MPKRGNNTIMNMDGKLVSLITVLISLLCAAHESQGQEFVRGGFNPDDPPEANIKLLPYLSFGAQLELEYQYQRNADLDTTNDEDFTTIEPALVVALSFDPSKYFQAYIDMKLAGEFEFEDGHTTKDRATLEVELAYILLKELWNDRLAFQIGRQRFEDERQWLFDAELDGARAFLFFYGIDAEFSVTRGGIVDVDLINRDAGDKTNNYITYWTYNFSEDTNIAAYFVFRDNTEDEEESAITLGAHSDGDFTDSLGYWLELAYAFGTNDSSNINGIGFDLGSTYVIYPTLEPSVTLGYAFAGKNFMQTGLQGNESDFNGAADFLYYGQLFDPELNNMSIFTAGAGINPTEESSSIDLVYHYYVQTEARDSLENSGIDADPDGRNKSLGSEIDLVLGYEGEESGFAAALVLGYFIPGNAFPSDAGNSFLTNLTLEYRFQPKGDKDEEEKDVE
ncbi:MAG: alginate export family protein [Thermodesulfobacteriota bacterium]